jgi:hypothetical protein
MTLSFDERLSRLAETDLNMDRIRSIEKCFGNDNKVSAFSDKSINRIETLNFDLITERIHLLNQVALSLVKEF